MRLATYFWILFAFVLGACGKPPTREKDAPPPTQHETISIAAYPETQAEECASFQKTLPADYIRERIQVPENWNHPEGNKIEVFFYGRINPASKTPPVIFFNGGPAGSSHSSFEFLEPTRVSKKDLNFLFVDQRGTGCSTPYPTELTRENVKRLALYSSRSIVRDAEAIRKKLFGEKTKWRVFGQSYGGDIVHRYVEVAPEGVDAAYAHGSSILHLEENESYYRLKSQKRVIDEYFKVHPTDAAVLRRIRDAIPRTLCFSDTLRTLCGSSVLDKLLSRLGFNRWDDLHNWIQFLDPVTRNADPKLSFRQALTEFLTKRYFHVYEPYYDLPNTILKQIDFSLSSCKLALNQLEREGEKPNDWLLRECRYSGSHFTDKFLDKIWSEIHKLAPRDPFDLETIRKSLEKHLVPFFLYSGMRDTFVPVESFASEVKELAGKKLQVTYREFPNSGHEGFESEDQVWEDLKK